MAGNDLAGDIGFRLMSPAEIVRENKIRRRSMHASKQAAQCCQRFFCHDVRRGMANDIARNEREHLTASLVDAEKTG